MFNPIEYLLTNISWYEPIYNLAWVLFMLYALTMPPLLLALFKLPTLRLIQPSSSWKEQRQSYGYLIGATFVIFSFRLIPYWIFNDKILHFLGGGIAIALVYEYLVVNFKVMDGEGIFTFRQLELGTGTHLLSNLVLLFFFASAFSVFSELYEFISKYAMSYQFDSSGFDTWLDILANMGGAFSGYILLWGWKYTKRKRLAN